MVCKTPKPSYHQYKGYGAPGDSYDQYYNLGDARQGYQYKDCQDGYGGARDKRSFSPTCPQGSKFVRSTGKCYCDRNGRRIKPLCFGIASLSDDHCHCETKHQYQALCIGKMKWTHENGECFCKLGFSKLPTRCKQGDTMTADRCDCIPR